MTMATTIEQQVALDEALVPSTQRLRIGRSNFRLQSDIQSKESTLQVIYDVLRSCPFFKAFLVTADVPKIYMHEFWATTYVHHHSIKFKLDNKKHIVNLEIFRDMLHISPRTPGQSFDEPPFKEEILEFLCFRLSQAHILWGLYHSKNIDYAFLIWEDFVYQVEHKNQKKRNEMYYPRFIKVIIYHFMSKDLSIPRRNKVNWHYVWDDIIFLTIKVVSRHQNTQQYSAVLPIELMNEEIRNSKAYKEYYAYATGEAAPKPKASARKKRSGSDTSITPPTAITTPTTTSVVTPRLTAAAKGKQPAKAKSPSDPLEESDGDETREEKSFDPIPRTPEDSKDDGNGEEDQGLRISEEERIHEEEEADELYRDVDINQGRGLQLSQDVEDSYMTLTPVHPDGQQESSSVSSQFVTSMLNPTSDAGMESIFATASSPVAPLQKSTPIMTPSTIATITTISHAPIPPTTIPSEVLQNLPTFDIVFHIEDRLKSLEAHFSKYIQTNPFFEAVSNIPADLLEMELKKILIEKMEGNKFIQRSDEQRNLYKALVEAYEADKIILDTYGERVILKRRRDDDDDDQGEGLSAGSDPGSKKQRERKEPESASPPFEPATRSAGRSTTWFKSRQASASESAFAEEPVQTSSQIEEPSHPVFETDTPLDFPNFIMNRLRVDTSTPDLLARPTYELMKGSCNSLTELEYHLEEVYKATTDQLDWVNPEGQQYPHNLLQPLPLIPNNRGRRLIPFEHFINNDLEYLRGGASS
nr:hypothetical protein [Tanacetum cinerariifolium]